jgi:multiple sugar transport system substrate-binding protein
MINKLTRSILGLITLAAFSVQVARADTTLSFPTWQAQEPGFSQWWKELIAAYEHTHPGVRIALQQIAYPDYANEMTIRFASNTPPDILELSGNNFGSFAAQGWLEPLDNWMKQDPLPPQWSSLQSLYKWDGKTLGVLVMGYGNMLFYNERLLADAGVSPPRTFTDFLAAVPKITNRSKGIYGVAAVTSEYPTVLNEMLSYIRWQGQDAFKGGKYTFTDPGVVAALETYRKVVGANAPLGSNQTMQRQTFLDGKAGFTLDGPWVYALFKSAPETVRPSLRMMAVPFTPHLGGAANSLHIPSGISADRKHLVWEFIRLAMQPEWQRRYFVLTSSPPGLPSSLTEDEKKAAPQLVAVADAATGAEPFIPTIQPIQANVNEFVQILERAAVRLISTNDPVTQICAETQAQLQRAIPLN